MRLTSASMLFIVCVRALYRITASRSICAWIGFGKCQAWSRGVHTCGINGFIYTVRNNDNLNSHKYVCITTYQPDTKSNPNPNPHPKPTTNQHAIVNIELNIVTCPTYPDKFIRDNVVAPSVPTSVVIITLPYL